MELIKDSNSFIYKKVMPVTQIGFFIMLFSRSFLDNTPYEIGAVWLLVILGAVWTGLIGSRELFIKGNKGYALLCYSLSIGYVIFMIYSMFR